MRKTSKLSEAVHVELLASVFATVAPSIVMSALFSGVGAVVISTVHDGIAALLYAAGLVATVARLAVTLRYCRRFRDGLPAPAATRRIERTFASAYLAFAVPLGLFVARVLWLAPDGLDMAVVALAVGYAAGVSTGVALRPRIAVAAMLCGVVPAIAAAAAAGGVERLTLAITLAGLLGGGIRSTLVRYRGAVAEIGMRQLFSGLARSDPLTGLPNRLGLGEHLDALVRAGASAAICCIDLDDFKPVNDRFGHPVGDAVLRMAADRLRALTGTGDIAARIGGDEFVLVRRTAGTEEERKLWSLRVAVAMSEPYVVQGRSVPVGASVGMAVFGPADDPEAAIARADEALYAAKRSRSTREGITVNATVRLHAKAG